MKTFKVILLYPFSLIYGLIVNIRNTLFDLKIIKSEEFKTPVISVGNITVGGTGKTPVTEYLIRLLQKNYNVAVLSRGYKRKTKGYILAKQNTTVNEIGDEPYQIQQKFPNITVVVDEKRTRGIKNIQKLEKKIDLIILDDAFQHRKVKPGLSILLIDYTQPFFEDYFLPLGRLRDSPKEMHRAHIFLVTKAPNDIKPIDMRIMAKNIEMMAYQTLYFTSLKYCKLNSVYKETKQELKISEIKDYSVILVTGVGNTKPVFSFCEKTVKEVILLKFKDHHNYSEKDIRLISEKYQTIKSNKKIVITTEKDAGKIKDIECNDPETKKNMFYCPVEVEILNNDKEDVDKQIISYINKGQEQYRFLSSKKQY